MFDEIICRAKKQARARIVLSAHDSGDLQQAATLIEKVATGCPNQRLAFSLNHMLDRLNRIIAAGDCRRERFCFGEGTRKKPIEYMTAAELAQDLADTKQQIAELKAKMQKRSSQ
jgi:hypothetical protein